MAWLLHEPRLVAKVPVFCIIGVKPLLCNPAAPLSVSIGAVHLLTHLHGRLEVIACWICDSCLIRCFLGNSIFLNFYCCSNEKVLIRDDKEDYVDCDFEEGTLDGDTPILWEVCVSLLYFIILFAEN